MSWRGWAIFAFASSGVAVLLALPYCSSNTSHIRLTLLSEDSGVEFRMKDNWRTTEWKSAGGTLAERFMHLPYEHNVAVVYIDVRCGDQSSRGRLFPFDYEYSSSAMNRCVESLDGAAYFLRKGTVHVQLPIDGNYLVSYEPWGEDSCAIDGVQRQLNQGSEVFPFNARKHEVENSSWKVNVDSGPGYSVQLFEWGQLDDVWLRFDHEPDQLKDATVRLEDSTPVPLSKLEWKPGFRSKLLRFDLTGTDDSKCIVEVQNKYPRTVLTVRVTRGI